MPKWVWHFWSRVAELPDWIAPRAMPGDDSTDVFSRIQPSNRSLNRTPGRRVDEIDGVKWGERLGLTGPFWVKPFMISAQGSIGRWSGRLEYVK
jgi:hypothetical protein